METPAETNISLQLKCSEHVQTFNAKMYCDVDEIPDTQKKSNVINEYYTGIEKTGDVPDKFIEGVQTPPITNIANGGDSEYRHNRSLNTCSRSGTPYANGQTNLFFYPPPEAPLSFYIVPPHLMMPHSPEMQTNDCSFPYGLPVLIPPPQMMTDFSRFVGYPKPGPSTAQLFMPHLIGGSPALSKHLFPVYPRPGTPTQTLSTLVEPLSVSERSIGVLPRPAGFPKPGPHSQFPKLSYTDQMSVRIWQYFIDTRQNSMMYAKKVHLRNALRVVISSAFKNSKLFIVGSSLNGFGSDKSDLDMCLTITSQDLQQKAEAAFVLSQLLSSLRKCRFIFNPNLIRAKVPILKFHDTLTGIDCDINVNNIVGIYNTHLLAMYTRVDWRLRPLGMFVKHWAQRMDIHDGSRGRLSTYPLLLMLIQYLQVGCTPAVLPNLQARFPSKFSYELPVNVLDMWLELPWHELRSGNKASLAELFAGFIEYYSQQFDFGQWAVSVRHGAPLPIDIAIRHLPPHEQAHAASSFKIFVEEPFSQANAARSLYDDGVFSYIKQAFHKTNRVLRLQKPLENLM